MKILVFPSTLNIHTCMYINTLPQKILQRTFTIHFIKMKTNVQKERALLSFETFCSNV